VRPISDEPLELRSEYVKSFEIERDTQIHNCAQQQNIRRSLQ
jgi:hypothetical protein